MKKLIAIGLMVLSPLTFAKNFNPEVLIGTWQCKSSDFVTSQAKGKFKSIITYHADGSYYTEENSHFTYYLDSGATDADIVTKMTGVWNANDNVLTTQAKSILNVNIKSDSSILKLVLGKYNNKNNKNQLVVTLNIKELNQDNLILKPTEELAKKMKSTGVVTCYR